MSNKLPNRFIGILLLLVVALVVFQTVQGFTVQRIGFFGMSIEFGEKESAPIVSAQNVEQLSASEREGRQARLEEKMTELQAKLDEALTTTGGGAVATPGQPASGSQGVRRSSLSQPSSSRLRPASTYRAPGSPPTASHIWSLM